MDLDLIRLTYCFVGDLNRTLILLVLFLLGLDTYFFQEMLKVELQTLRTQSLMGDSSLLRDIAYSKKGFEKDFSNFYRFYLEL